MGHYLCICKVNAYDPEEALAVAKGYLEDSTGDGKRFDYLGECSVITEEKLKEFGVKSFEELEEKYRESTYAGYNQNFQQGLWYIRMEFLRKFLPDKELSLYLDPDTAGLPKFGTRQEYQEFIEEAVKLGSKRGVSLPQTFEEFDKAVREVVHMICKNHMAMHCLKAASKCDEIEGCPTDIFTALDSYDNQFCDMTDDTEGDTVYYIDSDRHG